MFTNYIKLAWRVLWRRKFFTFISLFGISFTLMALMLVTSAYQTELGGKAPMSNQDDMIMLDRIQLRMQYYDTIPVIDTSLVGGVEVYDTTQQINEAGSSNSTSGLSRNVIETFFSPMTEKKHIAIYNASATFDIFKNGTKITVPVNYCNPDFWNVFDFNFIEGKPWGEAAMEQEELKTVISSKLAMAYFGRNENLLNETITLNGQNYEIVGVVEDPPMSMPVVQREFFVPSSLYDLVVNEESFYQGGFHAVLVAKTSTDLLKKEIRHVNTIIPNDRLEGFNEVKLYPGTFKEKYSQGLGIFYDDEPAKSYKSWKVILFSLLGLFVLLPTLNLINLNVSRILDRSSEIGVRKAFGAHQGNIILQFVFENIVLTLLGGIIGFLLALGLMYLINSGGYLGKAMLTLDFKFAIYCLLITIFFGMLSGFLPAYRMSKTQIVTALKQNQL